MKKVFILFLLIFSINASAQLSLSFKNGVLITDAHLKKNVFYNNTIPVITYMPELTAGYSFGNISANVGFSYTKQILSLDEDVILRRDENDPGIPGIMNFKYSYSYLSVPLYASYQHKINDYYIGGELGTLLNFGINNNDFVYAKSFIPSLLVGLKAGYSLTDKISIDITGRYNLSLSYMNEDNFMLNGKLNSIVILAGINYKF